MNLIKKSLSVVVVFMLGTLFTYANVTIISKKTKAVKVVFENVEKNHSLTVIDSQGVILHKENVSSNGHLVKFFDFSSLKDGKYQIQVDKEFEVLVKNIEIKKNTVLLNDDLDEVVFKPVVMKKNNFVFISRINFDKTPMHVSIFYKDEQILDETITSNKDVIEKAYKLDDSIKGDYKVVVHNHDKSVVKEFSL